MGALHLYHRLLSLIITIIVWEGSGALLPPVFPEPAVEAAGGRAGGCWGGGGGRGR